VSIRLLALRTQLFLHYCPCSTLKLDILLDGIIYLHLQEDLPGSSPPCRLPLTTLHSDFTLRQGISCCQDERPTHPPYPQPTLPTYFSRPIHRSGQHHQCRRVIRPRPLAGSLTLLVSQLGRQGRRDADQRLGTAAHQWLDPSAYWQRQEISFSAHQSPSYPKEHCRSAAWSCQWRYRASHRVHGRY